jgi:2-keto-4-pentenoate hydratase/2-oxohepta-3-ene-1,7-dioic acid hydratase in catechol pathway
VPVPKDRDFALVLGPVVVTGDELAPEGIELAVQVEHDERLRAAAPPFDWEQARLLAAAGTTLRPGDVLAGPAAGSVDEVGGAVTLDGAGIGVLSQAIA